jgi:endonuclease/exonuclease/phosphatase family metal-dependent hydrolase
LQAQKINELVKKGRYPAILAGDLNALPDSKSIETFKKVWSVTDTNKTPSFTYPPGKPEKKIDYIMYRPAGKWKVKEHKTICDKIASDHCAYFVTLELKK